MAPEISEELLQAADQYMLEPLKRLCEAAIAAGLSTDNLASVYDLSENFNAPQLGRHCMLYALEHYEELVRPGASCHCVDAGHTFSDSHGPLCWGAGEWHDQCYIVWGLL